MKRPAPWQARRIATAKALRALPDCATPGCKGKAMAVAWGLCLEGFANDLCAKCAQGAQRAQREKRT